MRQLWKLVLKCGIDEIHTYLNAISLILQIVTYNVADAYSGYIADVKYEGVAQYPKYEPKPAYHPAPKPVYHA